MKNAKKFFVSVLAFSSLFLTTYVVNAEEAPTTPTPGAEAKTSIDTNQKTETIENGTNAAVDDKKEDGTNTPVKDEEEKEPEKVEKKLADLTKEDLDEIVKEPIEMTFTKTEYGAFLIKNENKPVENDPVLKAVREQIITLFKDAGYSDIQDSNFNLNFEYDRPFDKMNIWVQGKYASLSIQYKKEAKYNEKDEKVLNEKLEQLYQDGKLYISSVYDQNDENAIKNWEKTTNDYFDNILNDKTITVKRLTEYPASCGEDGYCYYQAKLFFYKDDVLYAVKTANSSLGIGIVLENGAQIYLYKVNLDTDNEYYQELNSEFMKEMEKNGFKDVLGFYESSSDRPIEDEITLSYTVGNEYNGKNVKVLLKKADETFTWLDAKVENGKVIFNTKELGTFMIALGSDNNNVQTSSINVLFYSLLAVGSLLGIGYLVYNKKKKMI